MPRWLDLFAFIGARKKVTVGWEIAIGWDRWRLRDQKTLKDLLATCFAFIKPSDMLKYRFELYSSRCKIDLLIAAHSAFGVEVGRPSSPLQSCRNHLGLKSIMLLVYWFAPWDWKMPTPAPASLVETRISSISQCLDSPGFPRNSLGSAASITFPKRELLAKAHFCFAFNCNLLLLFCSLSDRIREERIEGKAKQANLHPDDDAARVADFAAVRRTRASRSRW